MSHTCAGWAQVCVCFFLVSNRLSLSLLYFASLTFEGRKGAPQRQGRAVREVFDYGITSSEGTKNTGLTYSCETEGTLSYRITDLCYFGKSLDTGEKLQAKIKFMCLHISLQQFGE